MDQISLVLIKREHEKVYVMMSLQITLEAKAVAQMGKYFSR